MAFDDPTRARLARFVSDTRSLLAAEFTRQLQNDYGLDPDTGDVTDLAKLKHLDDARRETARLLRETMEHYLASADIGSEAKAKKARQEALARIVREQAFTILNRLCALRMSEARGLLVESIAKGYQSKGFQLYQRVAGTALGETGDAYRVYLFSVCDEFSIDLPVLFDRFNTQGRLFPREAALLAVLDQINHIEIDPLWAENETIGWIYQYFNSNDERKAMRDASSAPRNSRELAVRNQFFTPRYVVAFLTDNTLGRIWYEMTKGQTALKDSCRYAVRRPNEVFLSEGEIVALPLPFDENLPEIIGDPKEAYQRVFLQVNPEDYTSPSGWIKEVFEGNFANMPADSDDPYTQWVGAAIPPDKIEIIVGEKWRPMDDNPQLDCLRDSILNGSPAPEVRKLPVAWAVLSAFARTSQFAAGYERPAWRKLWGYFRRLAQTWQSYGAYNEKASQEAMFEQPVLIPYRMLKDPRDIKMLDPACGSMHFGLYAFDLFERIYDEAWDLEDQRGAEAIVRSEGLKSLHHTYANKDEFRHDVPRLIIERNIHGIDIDPRAVQIAGLSLWLRAQKAWQTLGVKPQERRPIARSNIVCAEPMPGEAILLSEFVGKYLSDTPERKLLSQLLRRVFEAMKLAGEAGSLLNIEQEVASAVADAKKVWLADPSYVQQRLFSGDTDRASQIKLRFDVAGITDAIFWEEAEDRLYASLQAYAEQAELVGGYRRRLFADDAARGFAFIDICRKRYEVVVMNPPFGEFSTNFREFAEGKFVSGNLEILAAFVERGLILCGTSGLLGAITSRTAFFQTTMAEWRQQVVIPSGTVCWLELGMGVLDAALVETVMYVLGSRISSESLFIGPKSVCFLDSLLSGKQSSESTQSIHLVNTRNFKAIEGAPFAYWLSPHFFDCIQKLPSLEESGMSVRVGLQTGDDFRFVRLWWEVSALELCSDSNKNQRWVAHAKGGDNSPYFVDVHLVVNWAEGGREISEHPSAVTRSSQFYLHPGLTFSYRTHRFSPAFLPRLCITGVAGMGIFIERHDLRFAVAFLNTSLVNAFISARLGLLEINALYQAGTVSPTPFPPFSEEAKQSLATLGTAQFQRFQAAAGLDEASRRFLGCTPLSPLSTFHCLRAIVESRAHSARVTNSLLAEGYDECDQLVSSAYHFAEADVGDVCRKGLSVFNRSLPHSIPDSADVASETIAFLFGCAFGRWDVRYPTGEKIAQDLCDPFAPLPACPPSQLQNERGLPVEPHDMPVKYPVSIPWDGMLVDDPSHPLDIERRVCEIIEIVWTGKNGGAAAEAIEHEACGILDVNSLRDYFRKSNGFFAEHLKRYSKSRRSAPIYWPLSTASGSYTVWLYYHRLTDQTLFICLNDLDERKLKQVDAEIARLRGKNNRSSAEEDELVRLCDLELELRDFRDELLRVAKFWKPNLNDGVQITAAPLWKLFQHRQWQARLKETWEKLEAGEYDWAHLAFSIWPDRVVKASHKDRSYAIAHDLEDKLWEEVQIGKDRQGNSKYEWRPKKLSDKELNQVIAEVKAHK